MMDFVLAITSLTKGLEVLKSLNDIDKSFDIASYKIKIAELMSTLADGKIALITAREEISDKEKEIARLKESFRIKDSTMQYDGYSYRRDEEGNPVGRPYCPRCEQVDARLLLLVKVAGLRGEMNCPECKAQYSHVSEFSFPE